ncbi:MAG: SH3 domain-containing protein [Fimbriimonadaceae bacterium]|nr:SH3 domain-containing protein [Fimbriimonadaceae bacterium]
MRAYVIAGLALVAAAGLVPQAAQGQDPQKKPNERVVKTEKSVKKIPFKVRYVPDRNVGAGRIVPATDAKEGRDGEETTTVTKEYVDGKVVATNTLVEVTTKPVDLVFKVGMEGHNAVSRGSYTRGKVLDVVATAYMPNEGRMNPGSSTATGRRAEFGIVAVDPRVIPLNSILFVEGYGLAIAADTGGAIKGNRIDVCLSSRAEMRAWGRKKVRVHVLREEKRKQADNDDEVGFAPLPVMALDGQVTLAALYQDPDDDPHSHDPASTPGLTAEEAARAKAGATKPKPPADTGSSKPARPERPTSTKAKFPREATVTKTDVIVRSKPTTDSDRVDVVTEGDTVTLWGDVRGWFRVKLDNGKAGYIRADLLGAASGSSGRKVKVTGTNIIVRSGASTSSSRVAMVSSGDTVTVVGEKNGWYKVKTSDGETGYIRADLLGGKSSSSNTMTVVKDQVLVRSKPTTKSSRVGNLSQGEKVVVLGKTNGWYKIRLESGKTGYVRADMLGRSGR